jgi:hypothetical protein
MTKEEKTNKEKDFTKKTRYYGLEDPQETLARGKLEP